MTLYYMATIDIRTIKVLLDTNKTYRITSDIEQRLLDEMNGYTVHHAGNTVFQSGSSYSISGFTNQVGSWNDGANYFDVYPPAGYSMAHLVAFVPSIMVIHFAGGVNGDDSMRCTWSNIGDRIRVYVQNTEQRSTPAANWLAIWRR